MHQLPLPYIISIKRFKELTSYVRLRTMNLKEGLEYLADQGPRKIQGNWVEDVNKSAATRLKMFRAGQITCVKCGLTGEHFHIERHKNDKVMPFSVNLYGWKGDREVMLTWDHIIPKSLGGSNSIENAQCMCASCNSEKGNVLPIMEMIEIVGRPNAHLMYKQSAIDKKLSIFDTIQQVEAEMRKLK
jgi:hypothetical protein